MMTFCIRTIRVGSFSSGIWKYTVGRNCDGVRGGSACDHAAAASMPEPRMATGMISLFMEDLLCWLHHPDIGSAGLLRCEHRNRSLATVAWIARQSKPKKIVAANENAAATLWGAGALLRRFGSTRNPR